MVTRKKADGVQGVKKAAGKAAKAPSPAKPARRTAKKAAAESSNKAEPTPAPAAENKAAPVVTKEVDLLGLAQMAAILRLHPLQLKQMAQSGKIPAVVVDGEWRFNKDLVQETLRRRSLGR